ncbi:portal protein [Pseudomonas phage Lana]|uniref:Uncharacterized protein n=1 Tax=Pseudomonas phage Lana TaxID=2530172 RepID=A0A481W818_9CAUD|nr:portal protein [Pseudomonas phage Lana]QBJ04572.1 hypothetical protein [Pseudomonas phage Lana]
MILPTRNLAGKARAKRPGSDQKNGSTIPNPLKTFNQNAINNISSRTDVNEIIRLLCREDGMFSSAANSMAAISVGTGFRLAGYDATGAMSIEVMSAAYSLMDGFSTLHDYSKGYNDKPGMQSLLSSLQTDVVTTGGCGVELVLDKEFGPERLVPIGYSTIAWEADGQGGRYPTQDGGDIKLNIPTVFVAEHNRNPDEAYSVSLLRPGLSQVMNFNGFIEDMHRALNRTGHSRLIASIVSEKIQKAADDETRNDPAKMGAMFDLVLQQVQEALAGLEPEDAVVTYDSVVYDVKDTGGNKADYAPMIATLANMLGASLKTPASVSGMRASGGQGLSNAETLIYLQVVQGTRSPVEEAMSRALTLACRLQGVDGYVAFEFNPINLRPDIELEAYFGTRQKRVLELLSWGVINEAHACWELGMRPQGLNAILAGTRFYAKDASAEPSVEPDRTTSTGAALNPGTPAKSGGADQ